MNEPTPAGPILVIAGFSASLINFRGPLLQALRTRGYAVEVAAPGLRADQVTTAQLSSMDVSCHEVPLSRSGMNPFADLRLLYSLIRLMRERLPSAVFTYSPKASIFGLIAASIARVPRRYSLITGVGYAFLDGDSFKRCLARSMSKFLYRISLKHATKLFFQNSDDLRLFRTLALFPPAVRAVVVNGSGVDLAHFSPSPLPSGPIRFVMVARLLSAKGIREYAAAASVVRQKHPDVEFDLVGGTDTNPDSISASELEGWTRARILNWLGQIPDVRPAIARSHVYVLPSYGEGTPRSTLEAMAMGRPIITADAPGCRETVKHGVNGFLVPPRSIDALAHAMARFIDQPALIQSMGAQSRILAVQKYDVHEVNALMLREMELD